MNDRDRQRIVVNQENNEIHTVAESLYQEVEDAVKEGRVIHYLTHPNKVLRLIAGLKLKNLKGEKNGY